MHAGSTAQVGHGLLCAPKSGEAKARAACNSISLGSRVLRNRNRSPSSAAVEAPAMLHRTQCRIVRQTVGIVHILIAGETSKHCLAEKPPVSKWRVFLPAAAFRERQTRQIG